MPSEFLHQLADFGDLIGVVSREKGIVPQLIEKDYWIMHSLYGLLQQGFDFELKGGTSLSKAYRIIHRFSEDIDLRMDPPAGMDVKCGKNQTKPAHIASRATFFDYLAETIKIHGISEVKRDHAFDNTTLLSAGIRLFYSERFPRLEGLKAGILLELGFDDTTPNESIDISSWVVDKALALGLEFIDNRAAGVKCYHPAYTFVEKLQAVSTKFRKQQAEGTFPENFLRHYYDIYCLLGEGRVQEFIGTDEYEQRKIKRFPDADNRDISTNEAFLLTDPAVRALYEVEYAKTRGLYYAGMVELDVILGRLQENMDRL
ncbi:nucleotidyl transferase AbiEii/AbiGii toxin family protein [Geotalea toluenoxydans]|uniref:nucleotidyl transferase AbiEii/AbiGii toxin family protein n=1 Tax=Geotalea toluenoxydans TaxID=421624 RepID=UPI0006D0AE7B|nr:nucleotidyl transferase AbiEii/AbiGii toxin family protein [Geotalea toluenoxydans]